MSTEIRYEDGRLTVVRTFDAPREAVFEAWVETGKVERWWGCAQTTAVRSEIEPHVGGKYCHTMTIEGVGDYPANSTFTEFDPPARLAYSATGPDGVEQTVTVDFIARGERTEVRLVHENLPEDLGDIVSGGWTAAFDKLANFLTADTAH